MVAAAETVGSAPSRPVPVAAPARIRLRAETRLAVTGRGAEAGIAAATLESPAVARVEI